MKSARIVIIGGVACGPKAAARARRCDPQARITIIEQGELISYAGCNLAYYISGVVGPRQTLLRRDPTYFRKVMDTEVLTGTQALSIDRAAHTVEALELRTGRRTALHYDKLVLASGATPVLPPVEGRNLKGIFALKRVEDADAILHSLASNKVRRAVVVGAGLIGIEAAEALVHLGLKVTMVEALDWALPNLLDRDIAIYLSRHLEQKGVNLLLGQKVLGFEGEGEGKVRQVITERARTEADLVLVAIGVRPNVKLAKDAGLALGGTGAISVNEYLQTSDPDIYAGGDCVENTHLITGSKVYAPMGSTANKHGRIIGTNITGGHDRFPGVLGTVVVKAFDLNLGRVGLSEREAREAGFQTIAALVPAPDRTLDYPGSKDILVKLVADATSRRVLGGQIVGEGEVAKRIDVLATALAFSCNLEALSNLDLGYAPPYNSAMEPLQHAANVVLNKRSGLARGLTPAQVKAKLDRGDDFVLLDVRNLEEWKARRIGAPQVRHLPQDMLREKLAELPRDKEIVTLCLRGVRAYQAQRLLEGAGFTDVKFMEGSLSVWPYEASGEGE